jgi:hypothetical protein
LLGLELLSFPAFFYALGGGKLMHSYAVVTGCAQAMVVCFVSVQMVLGTLGGWNQRALKELRQGG